MISMLFFAPRVFVWRTDGFLRMIYWINERWIICYSYFPLSLSWGNGVHVYLKRIFFYHQILTGLMLRYAIKSIPRSCGRRRRIWEAAGVFVLPGGRRVLSLERAPFPPVCEACLYLCGVVAKYVPWFIRCFISGRCFPSPAAVVFSCRSVYLHRAIPQISFLMFYRGDDACLVRGAAAISARIITWCALGITTLLNLIFSDVPYGQLGRGLVVLQTILLIPGSYYFRF